MQSFIDKVYYFSMDPISSEVPSQKIIRKHSYLEALLLGPMTRARVISLLIIVILSVGIAGYSFWVGLKHDDSTEWVLPPAPTPMEEVPTIAPTESPDPTVSPTPIRTPSPTKKPTGTPTMTTTPTSTVTNTPTVTVTSTNTPTHTPTNTPTDTPTHTPTQTPTDTPTETPTTTP